MAGVYPRVYGATCRERDWVGWCAGLSPCVRGYPGEIEWSRSGKGSIPVCTGLPMSAPVPILLYWVYPRVYGATSWCTAILIASRGLSPCVRGYPECGQIARGSQGSIPVCTGLPFCSFVQAWAARVYPRVYGATSYWTRMVTLGRGLSPCVRGYPKRLIPLMRILGSIPVCTGLPYQHSATVRGQRVYPRVYGATKSSTR